jgi:hypothetical protein
MNRDRSLNHLRATKEDLIINELGGLDPNLKDTEVVRYEIAHGSKRLIYAGHSRGLTEDLGDLLNSAPDAMKADRVVLFNRAHGMAMHGLRGDAGNTSISELENTLTDALHTAGKQSFDIIDFDSCLIGNAQTLISLAPAAKFMIASEEPEVAVAQTVVPVGAKEIKSGANAQPIAEDVRKLLLNSHFETEKAATEVWSTNEGECKKVSKDGLCGANTLGLYKSDAASEFSQAIDQLGAALTDTLKIGENKSAIESAINATPFIDGEPDGFKGTVKRGDLATFLNELDSGLRSHKIVDTADTTNGELHSASERLHKAMSELTVKKFYSYKPGLQQRFIEVKLPPAEMGGISIFLPTAGLSHDAFSKQAADDSIDAQPAWNKFIQSFKPE